MSDFEKLFEDFFALGFGKPRNFKFNTTVKDMFPSYWSKRDDNTYLCTVKTLGLNPEDVQVEKTEYGLKVFGKTELEGYWYDTSVELPIAQSIMNELDKIQVASKNGLTFIYLKLKETEIKKIEIERI